MQSPLRPKREGVGYLCFSIFPKYTDLFHDRVEVELPTTVVLHEREQLLRILGPPKVQVSKCSKKFQSGDRSLLFIHEI